jgi:hypothetical protein
MRPQILKPEVKPFYCSNDSALADTARPARVFLMKNAVESPPIPLRGAPLWPLSVAAYRALGEAGPDSQKHRTPLRAGLHENVQIALSQLSRPAPYCGCCEPWCRRPV